MKLRLVFFALATHAIVRADDISLFNGQDLTFDQGNNHPLATLYVSMLQRLGIETDRFGSGTTTMRGLEMA